MDQINWSDDLEKNYYIKVIRSFDCYRSEALKQIAQHEKRFLSLSEEHAALLPHRMEYLTCLKSAVEHNSHILQLITQDAEIIFGNLNLTIGPGDFCNVDVDRTSHIHQLTISGEDVDKVRSTLKQFIRDWSSEGAEERKECYGPILQEIFTRLHKDEATHILVPGAGLGRLAWEIARQGYTCQGNEWSLYMLFASNFVLNKCTRVNQFSIYPWIHQHSNVWCREDQLKTVAFPDINPGELTGTRFSMAAGDFVEVYHERDSWHCVATVYFIDTARNIIQYVETIWNILHPGGLWINLGPLLWHFSDVAGELSIDISYEDLRHVILSVGFTFLKEEKQLRSSYTQNPRSMLTYEYNCIFFVVQKPMNANENDLTDHSCEFEVSLDHKPDCATMEELVPSS